MRQFHTHKIGFINEAGMPPIGRGQPATPDKSSVSALIGSRCSKDRAFSSTARWEQMKSNIALANSFVRKQKSSLITINETIDLWRQQISKLNTREPIGHLFTEPLIRLSKAKFIHEKLFDDGTSTPHKIHIYEMGVRTFIEVPKLPLMAQHGFLSLIASSKLSECNPTSKVFELCSSELLQLLLSADKTLDRLSETDLVVAKSQPSINFTKSRNHWLDSAWNLFLKRVINAIRFPQVAGQSTLNLQVK